MSAKQRVDTEGNVQYVLQNSVRFMECPLYKCPIYRDFLIRLSPGKRFVPWLTVRLKEMSALCCVCLIEIRLYSNFKMSGDHVIQRSLQMLQLKTSHAKVAAYLSLVLLALKEMRYYSFKLSSDMR